MFRFIKRLFNRKPKPIPFITIHDIAKARVNKQSGFSTMELVLTLCLIFIMFLLASAFLFGFLAVMAIM